MLKRSMDFTLAGLLLALTLPLMFISVVLIQLETGESAVFVQRRMGRGFRTFKLWKLRTMRSGCAGSAITLGADPRITRVGWWLRRLKIDELPQLWNVMRGDMSLVGSRPVIPELAVEFEADYMRLLAARPGLTDPATLKYRRETEMMELVSDPLDYFKTVIMPDKLRLSLEYLSCATFASDVGMLMRTAIALMPSIGSMLPGRWLTEPNLAAEPRKVITGAELKSIR